MTIIVLVSILITINIVLWIFGFFYFKKRFSSKRVLSEIEKEIYRLITDLNRQAESSVTAIEARRAGLMQLMESAKKYVELATDTLDKKAHSQDIIDALQSPSKTKFGTYSHLGSLHSVKMKPIQQDLFDTTSYNEMLNMSDATEVVLSGNKTKDKEEQEVIKSLKAPSFQMPAISKADKQIKVEKDLRTRVLELHSEGFDLDVIAKKLDMSITEVQLIVEMYGI